MDHQENKQGAEFNRLTVLNFRILDPNSLQLIARDLSLSLTPATLGYIQQYYRAREGRDATVGELRFLDALARHSHTDPRALRIGGLGGDEALLRIWQDVLRQQQALPDSAPPTPAELMGVLPRYLARAGICAKESALFSGTPAELAMHCHGRPPRLALELSQSGAVLAAESPAITLPQRAALLLLSAREGIPLENEIATLLSQPIGAYLCPLATPNAEGLLPHLLRLGGVMLDTAAIPGFVAEEGPAALAKSGKDTLLLAAPEQAVAALFHTGLALSLIGTLLPTGRLQLHHTTESTLSLELRFLQSLQSTRSVTLTPCAGTPTPAEVRIVESNDCLLGGIEVYGGAEDALLSLATKAVRHGAMLQSACLSVLLSLPHDGERALTAALPLLLELHRAAAELTLPCAQQRVILCKESAPCLSIFLSAPKSTPRELPTPKDFAEARALFYGV